MYVHMLRDGYKKSSGNQSKYDGFDVEANTERDSIGI